MPIAIQRRSGVPLYLQVKRQIERLVRLGVWEQGRKLPTERQLAAALGVSRNTVSAAYQELESEGLLSARQGSGTYVAAGIGMAADRHERLGRMFDLVLDEAIDLGMSPSELLELAGQRCVRRQELMSRVAVAFVECNREQLDYFTRELEAGSGVACRRILLDELRRDHEAVRRQLSGVDLVVTTLFHLDEVREFLPHSEVLGIALDPDLETVVRIARIPTGKNVGLLCMSSVFAERVLKSLEAAGVDGLKLAVTTAGDLEQMRGFADRMDVVIASPARYRDAVRTVRPGTEVIEFVYRPDAGSVNLLRSVLLDRKRQILTSDELSQG